MSYDPPLAAIISTLEHVTGLGELQDVSEFSELDAALVGEVLQNGADLVREFIAPRAAALDAEGCTFTQNRVQLPAAFADIWSHYADGGWVGLSISRSAGGLGLPYLIQAAFSEMVCGASVAVSMLPLLIRGAAAVVDRHGEKGLRDEYLAKLASGTWAASICITEADAGSDVNAIRTRAQQMPDGRWSLTGTKIFISFGDHQLTEGILHMVLADVRDSSGHSAGLGLFAVPAFNGDRRSNSVMPLRIEHKLGLHASPTCVMQFDDATGYLLGAPGEGLRAIFLMINLMRLEVAVQGVGLASAATRAAISYASERRQGSRGTSSVAIAAHPDVKRNLLTMRSLTDAARVLVYETAKLLDLAQHAADPAIRQESAGLAAFLLPVCKAGCAETAVTVTDIAIQVHGGHGYIRDTGIERLYRDARILPIYEGTTGIQAIDLVTRKLSAGTAFPDFLARIKADIARAEHAGAPASLVEGVRHALGICERCANFLTEQTHTDRDQALAGSTPFLGLVYKLALGWSWLRISAAGHETVPDGNVCARFYAEQILPELDVLERRVCSQSSHWLDTEPSAEALHQR